MRAELEAGEYVVHVRLDRNIDRQKVWNVQKLIRNMMVDSIFDDIVSILF